MMPCAIFLAQFFVGMLDSVQTEQRRHLALHLARIQQSSFTEIRLANLSGGPIDAVAVNCSSDLMTRPYFQDSTRRGGPFGKESSLLHRVRWPGPFVLRSVTLTRGGREESYPLMFPCQSGGRVLVVVDEKGEVTARGDVR